MADKPFEDKLFDPAPHGTPYLEAPAKRTVLASTWDWMRTYPETFQLTRLQVELRDRFRRLGLKPLLFDPTYYLAEGPIAPHHNALHHYLMIGEAEGRRPLAGFDPVYYRAHAGDAPLGPGSLLVHFFKIGAEQGLSPCADLEPLSTLAGSAKMGPLEYFFRWEEASRRDRSVVARIDPGKG